MAVPLKEIKDLNIGISALDEAFEGYENAEAYYKGDSPQIWLDPVILSLLGGFPYKLNFSKVPVTVYADRMGIASIQVQNSDSETEQVRQIWDANEMDIEEDGLIRGALKYGDYYLEVWEDDRGDARICGCNPKNGRMIYSPEDDRTPLFFVKHWEVEPKTWRADLRYSDRIERYISIDNEKTWDEFDEDGQDSVIVNPWNELPVFHLRTDRPYGEPVHKEAYGPSDAITKIAQSHLGTADYLGLPQRVALLDPEDPRGSSTMNDFEDGSPGSVQGGGSGGIVVDSAGSTPNTGELWAIRAKTVTEFKPAESKSFLDSMQFYIAVCAQLTQTPLRFFADPQGQHPSGFSLRTADTPMRLKSVKIQKNFSAALRKAIAFALLIETSNEAEPGECDDIPVIVKWAAPEVSDSNDEWQAAVEKLKAGVPQRQVFLDMGYTEEQCDSWGLTEEGAKAMVPQLFSGGSTIVSEAMVMASDLPNPPELAPPPKPEPKIILPPSPPGPPAIEPPKPPVEPPTGKM